MRQNGPSGTPAPTDALLMVRRGGALPLPRATARVAPTEGKRKFIRYRAGGVEPRPYGGLQGVWYKEESPSHGFAVPAPFRQGGQGDGGCGLPRALCALAMTGIFARGAVQGRAGDREGRPYGGLQGVPCSGRGRTPPLRMRYKGCNGRTEASAPTDTSIDNCQWPVA